MDMFFVYIFMTRGHKSSLEIIWIQQNTAITFRWHLFLSEKISRGAFASRRSGSFFLPSDAQKTAAANIVDPRLVTASKKRTSDPNQSSRLCVRNDIVIGVSVYSWITHRSPPRTLLYTFIRLAPSRFSLCLSFFRSSSLCHSFDNDYGRLSTQRLLRHPLIPARERVWQRFSRVAFESRRELDRKRRARRETRARTSWE